MPEAAAILARLDAIARELAALRDEVASDLSGREPGQLSSLSDAADLSPEMLINSIAAQERFGHPSDSIRKWCRTEGLGVKRGGRWMVSVPRLQRRINGK